MSILGTGRFGSEAIVTSKWEDQQGQTGRVERVRDTTSSCHVRWVNPPIVELERSPMERVKRIPVTNGNQ